MTRRIVVAACLTAALCTGNGPAHAATSAVRARDSTDEMERAHAEARELIDSYGGDTRKLIRAGRLIERILQTDPEHAGAHVQAARIVFRQAHVIGDQYDRAQLERAQALIDRALELDPKLPGAYRMAAWLAWARRDLPTARRLAARAEALEPESTYLGFLLAKLDVEEGRLDSAAQRYRGLIEKSKDLRTKGVAYGELEDVFWRKKDYAAAEAAAREAIRLNPSSAWAKGNYAERLVQLGKWDQAIEMGTAALAQMDYPAGRATLARAHLGKGYELLTGQPPRFEDALPHLRRAAALDPSNGQAHYWLGANYVRLYLQARDQGGSRARRLEYLNGAEQAFRRVLELEPTNAHVKGDLDRTLSEKAQLQGR